MKSKFKDALEGADMLLAKPFKLPTNLALAADGLYTTKAARLSLAKALEALEEREKQLKDLLIEKLPKSQASGIAGKIARASIVTDPVPTVEDWDRLYAFVKKTGQFD